MASKKYKDVLPVDVSNNLGHNIDVITCPTPAPSSPMPTDPHVPAAASVQALATLLLAIVLEKPTKPSVFLDSFSALLAFLVSFAAMKLLIKP